MINGAFALIQLAVAFVSYLQRKGLIDEGARRQFAKNLAAVAAAGEFTKELRSEVEAMTDEQLDDILSE